MGGRKKQKKKNKDKEVEIWTEEQYEDYLKGVYGLDFIAGYTEGGMPFGLPADETAEEKIIETENVERKTGACCDDDDLPF
ncbi:MAG TPA: hypothetical protein VFD79_08555 [Tissierellaceae bacterium]|nr:hypothetical protein [Tissierellaceae bacterium]